MEVERHAYSSTQSGRRSRHSSHEDRPALDAYILFMDELFRSPTVKCSEQSQSPCVVLYRVGKTRYSLGVRLCWPQSQSSRDRNINILTVGIKKNCFLTVLPEFRNNICPFECSQASPVSYDKSSMKIKMNVEYWWNDTDRGKQKYLEKGISTQHLDHHTSQMD